MGNKVFALSFVLLACGCGSNQSATDDGTSGTGAKLFDNDLYDYIPAKHPSLGLEVQATEMDVSLHIPGVTYDQSTFYTAATFSEALQTEQANRYQAFFELFRRHWDVITGVTLWGIADDNTWLSEFSSGRKDFPLLFDTDHQPKKAFDAVMNF